MPKSKNQNVEASEIAAIDFEGLLASPLIAVSDAQVQCAMAVVKFIKTWGFSPPMGMGGQQMMTGSPQVGGSTSQDIQNALSQLGQASGPMAMNLGKPRTISFDYFKQKANGKPALMRMTVPFLIMLPIPAMRIASFNLKFNCSIETTAYQNTTTKQTAMRMQGRFSDTKTSAEGLNINREYELKCEVCVCVCVCCVVFVRAFVYEHVVCGCVRACVRPQFLIPVGLRLHLPGCPL
mmetsp:Transcript_18913/g.48094  ORF Transcript_18913/g.48094 Transcript_18913/m.48094 type:complete len:236 (+) Transcript_18913:507-1214(+)